MSQPNVPHGSKGQQTQQQKQRTPVEDKNNLRSRAFGRVLDLVSEGPIVGLVNRAGNPIKDARYLGKAVYLNGTPMIGADGKSNFAGVSVAQTFGTASQRPITGFPAAEETISVGSQLHFNKPISITITQSETTHVTVAIRVGALFKQDKNTGDVKGSRVWVNVLCGLRDAPPLIVRQVVIKGKTQSDYIKEETFKLPKSGDPDNDTWTIRLVRMTEDADSVAVQDPTFWEYYTRSVNAKLRYPMSATIGCQFDAQQFGSIPTRGYRLKGRILKVPSNYFPKSRKYTRDAETGHDTGVEQVWDGTFRTAWSDNPAWCLFDICQNNRYGLGEFLEENGLDKWHLYTIARYCDGLVRNPVTGKMQPRYRCNLYLQERAEAVKVVTDMASIFRGMVYWASGRLVPVADQPKPVLMTFTNANVKDGLFVYQGTALRARHTAVTVRWNNPKNFYQPEFELVKDDEGIARYGYREFEISAPGCTDKGQAIRFGRWALTTELIQTQVCTWTAGLEGMYPQPGDIVKVMDTNRAGARHGGRILEIAQDRKSVTIDHPVTIEAGLTYTMTAVKPTGFIAPGTDVPDSSFIGGIRSIQIVTRTLTNAAGETTVLTFATPLDPEVMRGTVWAIENPKLEAQLFRVMAVTDKGGNEYEISGVEHNPGKYAAIERAVRLEEPPITKLPDMGRIAEIQNLTSTTGYTDTAEGMRLFIALAWTPPNDSNLRSFYIEHRRSDGNWEQVDEVTGNSYQYPYTEKGTYEFRVYAVNTLGVRSSGIGTTITIENTNPVPQIKVTGLEVVGKDGGQGNDATFEGRDCKLQWRFNSPLRAYDMGSEPWGAQAGIDDPYFQHFEITIWDTSTDTRVWFETTKTPRYTFTYEKNAEAFAGAKNTFRVEVAAVDAYNNRSPAATITPINPAPREPEALTVIAAFRSVFLNWKNTSERDLDHVEVWFAGAGKNFSQAELLATVAAPTSTFTHSGVSTGVDFRYWLRSIDTFGSHSNTFPNDGVSVTTGTIQATDLDKFAVDITNIFTNTVALKNDRWSDHTPVEKAIAWNPHLLVFRGTIYEITDGSTTDQYVWWRGPVLDEDGKVITPGETAYRTSNVHPKDGSTPIANQKNDFIIATNAMNEGAYDLAWRGMANALIGSAYIKTASITSAQIDSITADKITSGTITAEEITIGSGGAIKSSDYVPGLSGWALERNVARFNDVEIAGKLSPATGYFNPSYPSQLFQARPSIALPIRQWNSSWNKGAAVQKNQQALICRDGVTRYRRVLMCYGQLTSESPWSSTQAVPSPAVSPLFFSTTKNDYSYTFFGKTLHYFARPRRLANIGDNIFEITLIAKADTRLSVWYQIADIPVWDRGFSIASMGNTVGPIADPINLAPPWYFVAETQDAQATSGYQIMNLKARVKIHVPAGKCVLFGIAPMDGNGGRPVNGNNAIYNGMLDITAENVGNLLLTEDPGESPGEEPA